MNRNQRLVLWIGGILVVLAVVGGLYLSAGIIAVLAGVAWRKFDTRGKRPENIAVKSVRCGQCGAVGEPHWAKCPKCGAADWK
jgi:hypothetical protein